MNKHNFTSFLTKINLNGTVEFSRFESASKSLKSSFRTTDKSLIGFADMECDAFGDGEYGIYNISLLKKLCQILDDQIDVSIVQEQNRPVSIELYDAKRRINYALADLAIIPSTPRLKNEPTMDVKVPLTRGLVVDITKAIAALPDVKNFAISFDALLGSVACISIGDETINVNRITMQTPAIGKSDLPVTYYVAEYLKDILSANVAFEQGTIEVSEKGMMKITFNHKNNINVTYYLIKV